MFYFEILVLSTNFIKFKQFPDIENASVELDTKNFMEHLSGEYICRKTEVSNDSVQTKLKIIDCKTEDCNDLEEIFSISESRIEQEKKVRKLDTDFVFYHENSSKHHNMCLNEYKGI